MYGNESDTTEDDTTSTRSAPAKQPAINKEVSVPNIPPPVAAAPQPISALSQAKPSTPPRKPVAPPPPPDTIPKNLEPIRRQAFNHAQLRELMTDMTPSEHSIRESDDDIALEVEGTSFISICKFDGEQPGDLSVEEGEEVTLMATRSDGWWRCRKSTTGEVGLLPKNVLQHLSPRPGPIVPKNNQSVVKHTPEQISIPFEPAHPSTVFPDPPQHVIEAQMRRISEATEPPSSQPSMASTPAAQKRRKSASSIRNASLSAKQKEDTQRMGMEHLRLSKTDHYGLVCHLFPRLSESNINFHDIYWHWSPHHKIFKIRKRHVRVCKLFKVHAIGPDNYLNGFEVNFFLFDKRTSMGRQIVSNIYTANVKVETSKSFTLTRTIPNPFILRSNYNLPDVVLRAQVFHKGDFIGSADVTLLSETGSIIQNKKQFLHIKMDNMEDEPTSCRLVVQTQDIPSGLVANVDCLPDVLLCDESYVGIFAAYRNLLADYLAHRPNPNSAWINDPMLATFPYAACNDFLMKLLVEECEKHKIIEKENYSGFRQTYHQAILPLIMTMNYHDDDEQQQAIVDRYKASLKKSSAASEFLSLSKSRPIDPFDHVIDLASEHALD